LNYGGGTNVIGVFIPNRGFDIHIPQRLDLVKKRARKESVKNEERRADGGTEGKQRGRSG